MITRNVSRTLEMLNQPISQQPEFSVVYMRWQGEEAFKWAILPSDEANMVISDLEDPNGLRTHSRFMPHADAVKTGTRSKNDFKGHAWLVAPAVIDRFREIGYPYSRDYDESEMFKPTVWGEMPPLDYQLVFWCSYDHSMMNVKGEFIASRKAILVCSSSYKMSKIRELVAAQPQRFALANDEDYYVPGNGMSNNLMVSFTDEEYASFKMSHKCMTGLWEVARFFGFDYKEYEADQCDDDDDDDDI